MKHQLKEIILDNGARGILIHVPGSQVMSTQFHFRAGYRFVQDRSKYETAHIMEHMAFGASKRFKDATAYEAEFTRNGAYHNAYTSDNSLAYVAECADFEWDRILDLQSSAITEPIFREDEFVSEVENVRSELTGYLNSPSRLLWPRIGQSLGEPIHTYQERLDQLSDVTLADIKEHYRRTHHAGNMRFVIAGNFDAEREVKVVKMLNSWNMQQGDRLPIPVDEMHSADPFLIKRKDAPNVTFAWSSVVPRCISDEETDAMACLNHVLTGTFSSRILGIARKKGLAYHIFSDTSALEHNSSWDFGAQANLENVEPLFDIMVTELRRILDGKVDDHDIEAAKSYALGRHQMGAQTAGQINSWYANRYFFDGRIEDFEEQPELIQAVTKQRIVETAQEFFDVDRWVLGVYGNTDMELVQRLRDKLAVLYQD